MTYRIEPVAYTDAPGLSEAMMRAMNQNEHYNLLLNRATTEQLITDTTLRLTYRLSENRNRLRHQKVIHTETGQIVGYAHWELPVSNKNVWLDAQMPAVTGAEQKSFKDEYDTTELDGKHKLFNYDMGAYVGPGLGKPYNELVKIGGPYLVLDYMACHPAHQRKGVASMLLERGESEARKLGLKIFVMTATDPAGRAFYERRGLRNLRTVVLNDSRWGGTTPHVTSFLEKEV
ncbi:hypothetical protein PRZ48_009970 [Zasmidium cellare]|uniref:N-acetyltransferase domain-containing protein n=1 Tax=Zasmidium cellare TaxID=395010 RepID=A0ABR0EE81_ZASCE|nr:hypothetical protein PRZ48_009970 [Zasmidium cellare]